MGNRIIEVFVKMHNLLASQKEILHKIKELESKGSERDNKILHLSREEPVPVSIREGRGQGEMKTYFTVTSSQNNQALPPSPACPSGHVIIDLADILTKRAFCGPLVPNSLRFGPT